MRDFSTWVDDGDNLTGLTKKIWLTNGKQRGLFKFGEEWTEEIASGIANLLDIRCMTAEYGFYHGDQGVLCYDLGFLTDFGDILDLTVNTRISADLNINITYTLDSLESLVKEKDISMSTFVDILRMFMFDFIIGNRDRHLGNFAIANYITSELAALYDNASSLCYKLNPIRAGQMLLDKNLLFEYNTDIYSQVRTSDGRCSNWGLMYIIKEKYPTEWEFIIPTFLSLDLSAVNNIIFKFNNYVHRHVLQCIFEGITIRLELLDNVWRY